MGDWKAHAQERGWVKGTAHKRESREGKCTWAREGREGKERRDGKGSMNGSFYAGDSGHFENNLGSENLMITTVVLLQGQSKQEGALAVQRLFSQQSPENSVLKIILVLVLFKF